MKRVSGILSRETRVTGDVSMLDEAKRQAEQAGVRILDQALKYFGGNVKAVPRSSGGLIVAEPYQLLVYGESTAGASVRVRVRFRDFKRGPGSLVTSASYVTHTKTVFLEDLREPFSFDTVGGMNQKFLLDFGQGPVPVHVLHCRADLGGTTYAYFIEPADLDHLKKTPYGGKVNVQVYLAERNVLRFASSDSQGKSIEYDRAAANYWTLRRTGRRIVPGALKAGPPVLLPGGVSPKLVADAFRGEVVEELERTRPFCYTLDEEEGLKPFDDG